MTVDQAGTPATNSQAMRIEKDLVGECEVPAEAYYGVHTLRSVENFPITGQKIGSYPELVRALAAVKAAAARANLAFGKVNEEQARAIVAACEDIRAGRFDDQFVVDVIQGGAGTSTNMNANEVVANRALEILGHARGDYQHLHPLEHVNVSQSTNDVYPTAARIALYVKTDRLLAALDGAAAAFEAKAEEFADVAKLGRTQMQDAVPMTVGQEFGAFASWIRDDAARIRSVREELLTVNIGGTAIGTGLNTPAGLTISLLLM
ncbi:MAG TPA: lyase family protein [Actinomycetales bacterium]|nr:lyase family protein [Actinomycetales bacterium]